MHAIRFAFVAASFAMTFAMTSAGAWAGPITFSLMHTQPVCSNPGKPETWCAAKDKAPSARKSGMEARVTKMLAQARDPKKARISLGYLSFSNRAILEALCARGQAGVPVEVFLDDHTSHSGGKVLPEIKKLQTGCGDSLQVRFLGTGRGRLHHNKFLMVDSGADSVSLSFSSGNASDSGLSVHYDHWVVMTAPKSSDLVKTHACVLESLRVAATAKEAGKPYVKPYTDSLGKCLPRAAAFASNPKGWIEGQLKSEGIAPIFSPDSQTRAERALVDHIDRVVAGGRIAGAIQHFTNEDVITALGRAVKRGVSVEIVMDDDVLDGSSAVPVARTRYYQSIKPAGIGARFLVTNSGGRQMMHHKFLVLDGVDRKGRKRVFSGAGQFTAQAMKDNFENFYLTEVPELTRAYEDLFAQLEKLSYDEDGWKKLGL